ncbi:MAG: hypothetical protein DCC49_13790 [Acidobacteria bacterium]|nr:MAG: hypothetical protein DCC49_13790 [Acidobacteriota bacterium]
MSLTGLSLLTLFIVFPVPWRYHEEFQGAYANEQSLLLERPDCRRRDDVRIECEGPLGSHPIFPPVQTPDVGIDDPNARYRAEPAVQWVLVPGAVVLAIGCVTLFAVRSRSRDQVDAVDERLRTH